MRDRSGPPEELLADLAATIREGPWTAVDVRALLLPPADGRAIETGYLAMRGVFQELEPLTPAWQDPPIWRGAVSLQEAADAVKAWGEGRAAALSSIVLPCPQFHSVSREPRPSSHLQQQGHLGNAAFGVPTEWSFRYWHVYGNAISTMTQPSALSLVHAAARWTGDQPADVFRFHVGTDITHSAPGRFEVFLPSPYAVRLESMGEGCLAVNAYSLVGQRVPTFWVSTGVGPWDIRLERHRVWSPTPAPKGWSGLRQEVPVDAELPAPTVWVGEGEEPSFALSARAPVTGLAAQREAAWRLLQEQQKPVDRLIRLAANDKMKNGAAFLELGIGNALVAAGWQVLHAGVPAAVEGIDLVAFHEPSQRALCLSVTLGNSLGDKLRRMLDTRQSLAPLLSEWDTRWTILTSLDRANVVAGDVDDCLRNGVSVVTGEDLATLASDVHAFAECLVTRVGQDPLTLLLRGSGSPLS